MSPDPRILVGMLVDFAALWVAISAIIYGFAYLFAKVLALLGGVIA
ncbi:hypothetical protein [Halalkalirubrum salinum]|nr:hypothetical protein [Halalkalirubrum salinum]